MAYSDLMYSVNEGYFLITRDGLIFEVKGTIHPTDRYIAYLRYIPDTNGNRTDMRGTNYRKIYSLRDRGEYLHRNYPQFLWMDRHSDRIIQAVPDSEIEFVLNPIDVLKQLRDRKNHLSKLQGEAVRMVEILIEASGLPWSSIGITGSLLVGLDAENSDIDLVVYGERECMDLYRSLEDIYERYNDFERYEGQKLEKHTEFRWGRYNPWWNWLLTNEKHKLLQGLFHGIDYSVRCVKKRDEIGITYDQRAYRFLGEEVVRCRIISDSQRIFTPCEYKVECKEIPRLRKIVSFRGRFTEHAHAGNLVETRGRLESVYEEEKEVSLQLVLGEEPSDYLVTLSP